jgi:pilus assembly protein Flp/PilA
VFDIATFLNRRTGAAPRLREGTNRRKESAVKKFIKLLKDSSGASAAEYALILAIVGAAIAVAAVGLGNSIAGAMNNTADLIENPPTS